MPKELLATFPAFDRFLSAAAVFALVANEFCRNMNGEVTLEEVEQVPILLLLLQVVLLLSCRVRDIQISHWLGLLNAHWKVYPRGRDWLVHTRYYSILWVAMQIVTTIDASFVLMPMLICDVTTFLTDYKQGWPSRQQDDGLGNVASVPCPLLHHFAKVRLSWLQRSSLMDKNKI